MPATLKKTVEQQAAMRALGARIRHGRVKLGLAQGQFAALCKVTRRSVIRWETGQTFPPLEILQDVADVLRIDYLILRDGPEKWSRHLATTQAPVDPLAPATIPYDDAMDMGAAPFVTVCPVLPPPERKNSSFRFKSRDAARARGEIKTPVAYMPRVSTRLPEPLPLTAEDSYKDIAWHVLYKKMRRAEILAGVAARPTQEDEE